MQLQWGAIDDYTDSVTASLTGVNVLTYLQVVHMSEVLMHVTTTRHKFYPALLWHHL